MNGWRDRGSAAEGGRADGGGALRRAGGREDAWWLFQSLRTKMRICGRHLPAAYPAGFIRHRVTTSSRMV
jgi:hypothetical protein